MALLVAKGVPPADVLAAIAGEAAASLHPRLVQIYRWERDGSVTVVGTWGDGPNPFPAGSRWRWDDPSLVAMTNQLRTGQPVRIEDVAESLAGAPVDAGAGVGVGSAAGAPVMVEGEAWGHIGVAMAKGTPLPDGIEDRLAAFTELVSTSISSSETRTRLSRLADEQAALRRVATLIARGAPPSDVFEMVVTELGRLLDVGSAGLVRFDSQEAATVLASWGRLGEVLSVGTRLPLGGRNVMTQIARTGRAARVDDYAPSATGPIAEHANRLRTRTAIGGPIVVTGRLWGAMIAASLDDEQLPTDTALRLEQFTELVSTAIANAEARTQMQRLADEQAALRRVATLVAKAAAPTELFDAVVVEVARLLGATQGRLDARRGRERDRGGRPPRAAPGPRLGWDAIAAGRRQRDRARASDRPLGAGQPERRAQRGDLAPRAALRRRGHRGARRSPSKAASGA